MGSETVTPSAKVAGGTARREVVIQVETLKDAALALEKVSEHLDFSQLTPCTESSKLTVTDYTVALSKQKPNAAQTPKIWGLSRETSCAVSAKKPQIS